jgi:hypothetical protein
VWTCAFFTVVFHDHTTLFHGFWWPHWMTRFFSWGHMFLGLWDHRARFLGSQKKMNVLECAHLRFKCWDMGIVAWVMTNVVLDDWWAQSQNILDQIVTNQANFVICFELYLCDLEK